jgi:hypothetical protein
MITISQVKEMHARCALASKYVEYQMVRACHFSNELLFIPCRAQSQHFEVSSANLVVFTKANVR